MPSSITARQLAAWDRFWVEPHGWVTVTGMRHEGDRATIFGVTGRGRFSLQVTLNLDDVVTVEV